jgi:intracellular sulfur oxidation DsrE/DsrF family protein
MKIALSIFTNCTASAPNTDMIKRTYDSFCDCFDVDLPVKVFMDTNPNTRKASEYYENLLKIFHHCHFTNGLSMGYLESIQNSDADYLFQLEHDWQFNKSQIIHSLREITEIMYDQGIYHFRFNKRKNKIAVWDTQMQEMDYHGFEYCVCNNLSNNPHIIDRKKYAKEIINDIEIVPGSKGIEEELNRTGKYYTAIYGGLNHPATVTHLDGRKEERQIKQRNRGLRI